MKPKREKIAEGVPLALVIKSELRVTPDVVMFSGPRSVHAERFRRLKTVLVNTYGDQAQVMVVTSGIPGEGKSTVSLNLALAFAADGETRTLLIDGDLRRTGVEGALHPVPHLGLTEVLTGDADFVHAVMHLKNCHLHVLPSGSTAKEPNELLTSREAKELFQTLRKRYDRIIVDSPPVVLFTDADALGVLSDGIILVTRAGVTPKSAYTQAVSAVTSTRILGTVLNSASGRLMGGKSYDTDDYFSYYGENRKPKP
jgi:capsular exopolysaccharide synthesis family protein